MDPGMQEHGPTLFKSRLQLLENFKFEIIMT